MAKSEKAEGKKWKKKVEENGQEEEGEVLVEKGERKDCKFFFAARLKEEEDKEKKGRQSDNRPWASREDCYFSFCLWREVGCASTPQQKDCSKGQR